jgi:aspartyl-tRNA(Asn)/glutamyl-tRNA(Gln) amidotransferase subunit A
VGLIDKSVFELASRIRSGQQTAVDTVQEALRAIGRDNDALRAFVHVDADGALQAARTVDEAVAAGAAVGPLAGVPFGVKDLDDCIGMPTSLGSLLFTGGPAAVSEPPLVARLRAAGAVPVGKTATPEFGASSSTRSRAWGITRNPWHPERTPGGSSGGSAAAVSSGMVPFATGTDYGGSIRSPASFCGLVGLKPTHGLIPGDGQVTLGHLSDFHCWGVLTTTVIDTALLLNVAAGPAAQDRTSLGHRPVDYVAAAETLDVRGLRAAWSPDLGFAVVDPAVVDRTRAAASRLIETAGLVAVDIDIDLSKLSFVSLHAVEMAALLEADGGYPDRAHLLGDEVRHILERQRGPSLERYGEILRCRSRLQRTIASVFDRVDVILTPATACEAFAAEDPDAAVIAGRDASATGSEPFTLFANACWLPAISVPAGRLDSGLPIGLQIVARYGRDDVLLRLARLLELAQPWPATAVDP